MKIRRIIQVLTVILTLITACGANTSARSDGYYGALNVSGGKLCDESGAQVQLKGVSTHGIAWFPGYVTKDSISYMHSNWKINCIRLAMYTDESGGYCNSDTASQEKLKKIIDTGVNAAAANDMYAIIDWHILSDGNPNTYIDQAEDFFDEMSLKYCRYDNVLYEICNEPNGGTTWGDIKSYAEDIIPIIHKNAPNAVIIVGTPTWSQELDKVAADPIDDQTNIMYALHFYAATHTDALRQQTQNAIDGGLPVFVTEFGICDASGNGQIDKEQANKWMELIDSNGLSCCQWNLSNKDETSALIKPSCTKMSDWTKDDMSDSGLWMLENMKAF